MRTLHAHIKHNCAAGVWGGGEGGVEMGRGGGVEGAGGGKDFRGGEGAWDRRGVTGNKTEDVQLVLLKIGG